jgi:hypothetical protein
MTGARAVYAAAAPERVRALPPKPRPGDRLRAGLVAGTLLGVAEAGLAWATGWELPPDLALLEIGGAACLGGLAAAVAGIVGRARGTRTSYSALAGGALGPLLAAPALGRLLALALAPGAGGVSNAVGALLTLPVAIAAAAVGARLGDRLERSGTPLSAPFVLGPAALLTALGENGAESLRGVGGAAAALLLVLGVAALATALWTAMSARGFAPARWRTTLVGVVALACATAFAPRAAPWLVGESTGEGHAILPDDAPVSVLLLDLGRLAPARGGGAPASVWESQALSLLASDGVRYRRLDTATPERVAAALLRPDPTRDVAGLLEGRGWITAAFVRAEERAQGLAVRELDARPGTGALLDLAAPRLAAGPLLAALPSSARSSLGIAGALRTPEALGAAARRWLIGWRSARAHAPFLLAVDYGSDEPALDMESADDEIAAWERRLTQIGADGRTLVLVSALASDAGAPRVGLLVRPPLGPSSLPRGSVIDEVVSLEAVSDVLAGLARNAVGAEIALPPAAPTALAPGTP